MVSLGNPPYLTFGLSWDVTPDAQVGAYLCGAPPLSLCVCVSPPLSLSLFLSFLFSLSLLVSTVHQVSTPHPWLRCCVQITVGATHAPVGFSKFSVVVTAEGGLVHLGTQEEGGFFGL